MIKCGPVHFPILPMRRQGMTLWVSFLPCFQSSRDLLRFFCIWSPWLGILFPCWGSGGSCWGRASLVVSLALASWRVLRCASLASRLLAVWGLWMGRGLIRLGAQSRARASNCGEVAVTPSPPPHILLALPVPLHENWCPQLAPHSVTIVQR